MADIKVTLSPAKARRLRTVLAHLPKQIDGSYPDTGGYAKFFYGALIHHLLGQIHGAFIEKSEGQADRWGIEWEPVKPATKAYSKPNSRKHLDLPGPKKRPTLTPDQDALWLSVVRSGGGWGAAWEAIKEVGGWTLIDELGPKGPPEIKINVENGTLRKSIEPNRYTTAGYIPSSLQSVEFAKGIISIDFLPEDKRGTRYFKYVNALRTIIPKAQKHKGFAIASKKAVDFAFRATYQKIVRDFSI